jgi:hypothetical protein
VGESIVDTNVAMRRLITAYRLSLCVGAAVKLGIPEHLAGQTRTADELARLSNAHAPSLKRLLRALVAMEVLREDGSGHYALTALGRELRSDRMAPMAQLFSGEPHLTSWMHMDYSIKTGERSFDHVHGERTWDYYANHSEHGAIFDAAMAAITAPVSPAVAEAYDFSRFARIADIGGGDGTLLVEILKRHPSARGLLFDLPGVAARATQKLSAAGLGGRCEIVAGSFLETVPAGCDVYLMKSIVHDYDDVEARTLLKHCRNAIADSGAPLLIIERVLPEHTGPDDLDSVLSDLNMLTNTGGLERSQQEFAALLETERFRPQRVIPTRTPFAINEALPV